MQALPPGYASGDSCWFSNTLRGKARGQRLQLALRKSTRSGCAMSPLLGCSIRHLRGNPPGLRIKHVLHYLNAGHVVDDRRTGIRHSQDSVGAGNEIPAGPRSQSPSDVECMSYMLWSGGSIEGRFVALSVLPWICADACGSGAHRQESVQRRRRAGLPVRVSDQVSQGRLLVLDLRVGFRLHLAFRQHSPRAENAQEGIISNAMQTSTPPTVPELPVVRGS